MSVWGPGPTENDDAADWLAEFREEPSLRAVQAAIRGARRKGYLDVDRCAEAVVAAHVLADACGAAGGKPVASNAATLVVRRSLQALKKSAIHALCKDAAAAIATVRDDDARSELCQLWSESTKRTKWIASLRALEKRFAGAPAALAKLPLVPGAKRTRKAPAEPNVGKVFAIPLPNKKFGYAKGFLQFQFGIYDLVSTKVLPLEKVTRAKIAFHVLAISVAPRRGKWQLLGEEPFDSDDAAWGVPTASGLTNHAIATHLFVTERGVQRVVAYDEAIGMTVMAMGNETHVAESIIERVVKKKPPGWSDVVLPKSHPAVL